MVETNHLKSEQDALIKSALNKAIRSEGPIKLYHGKHDKSGLFNKNRAVEKKAALHGFGTTPCLWSEEHRSALNQPLLVRLQSGGLERLIEITPSEERRNLVEAASELYRRQLLERWSDLAAAKGWRSDFSAIAECCATLISTIQRLLPEEAQLAVLTEPKNNDGADFKRRMAHELVIAWKHADNTDAKNSIATALKNSGIEQIGEVGDVLPMDGGLHKCDAPAFPGDKVEIIESGWLVHDGVGEYLLEKAIVKLP